MHILILNNKFWLSKLSKISTKYWAFSVIYTNIKNLVQMFWLVWLGTIAPDCTLIYPSHTEQMFWNNCSGTIVPSVTRLLVTTPLIIAQG